LSNLHVNGEILDRRFEILSLFRSTKTGQTYLATDKLTQKKVIVKSICQMGNDQQSKMKLERLMNEAKILRALNHPSTVRFVSAWGNQSDFYLVTEYIKAKNMKETCKGNPPRREMIVEYILELLEVVEYLHSLKIIHHDIKPSNILLGDIITLIDFDASEISSDNDSNVTRNVMGTPGYQCPESFRKIVSPQSDIYSIGATLLFLLTGEDPSADLKRFKNLSNEKDLLEIAFKAMNPDPRYRFVSALEMKIRLQQSLSSQHLLIFGDTLYPITKEHTLIGRGSTVDLVIPDPAKFVSPIHAELIIEKKSDNILIFNKSVNGTHIYRDKWYHVFERWQLINGDIISLCYSLQKGPYRLLKFRKAQG
jgi:serine/threonine protein kinase